MNLHLLRTFAAVVTHGGFSRAANAIHVSQPAVSKAVRELEDQLDMPLLERSSRPLRLTEAGEALYERARAIFALEQEAVADLRARHGLEHGRLTIGASMTIATYLLPPLVACFLDRYPGVEVRIVSDNTEAVAQRLLRYELDVAFVEGPVHDGRIERTHWRDDELVILAPPDQATRRHSQLRTDELSDQRWVVREEGSGTRAVTTPLLKQAGIEMRRMLEVGSVEAVVQNVAAGLGLAMVSVEAVRDQLAAGRVQVIPVSGHRFHRPLHSVNLHGRPISPAAQQFLLIAA